MTYLKRTAAAAVILLAGIFSQQIKDKEGFFWSCVPPTISHFLRSNYLFAKLFILFANGSAKFFGALKLLSTKPAAITTFLQPPHMMASGIRYATKPGDTNSYRSQHQLLDVYAPPIENGRLHPVFVFIHGGIWTLFNRDFFRLVGEKFAERGIVCVVPSYSVHPDGDAADQINDVRLVLEWTHANIQNYGGSPWRIVLGGQSSGAHVSSQHLLRSCIALPLSEAPPLCGYIGMSGVYDPLHHNLTFEKKRGVNDVSPLVPATGGGTGGVSDTDSAEKSEMQKYSSCLMAQAMKLDQLHRLCPILLLHGEEDMTVPVESSVNFYNSVVRSMGGEDDGSWMEGRRKITFQLHVLENVDHATYLFDISVAGSGAKENSMMNSVVEFVDAVTQDGE